MENFRMNPSWRDQLLIHLRPFFRPDDSTHGLDHALKVEERALSIAMEPELIRKDLDSNTIQAAALLHDSGYSMEKNGWSKGKVEHVAESVRIARMLLNKIPIFRNDYLFIDGVCYLIFHHDDTNYSVPILSGGIGNITKPKISDKLNVALEKITDETPAIFSMLQVLRQADSQEGSSSSGAKRTWEYSVKRGLPHFASGNPTGSLGWEDSAITNVRLAAKRGLLDSFTEKGKFSALSSYKEAEEFIKDICFRETIQFGPEPLIEATGIENIKINELKEHNILEYQNWDQLIALVRNVPLKGDSRLFPYADAEISSELVPIAALVPLAKYALDSKIDFQKSISKSLLSDYAFDLFNLSGKVEFDYKPKPVSIAPPIVEAYDETEGEIIGKIFALVDGMHRCQAAIAFGLSEIRVILIRKIPSCFPLCPLPVKWEDVQIVENVPTTGAKRLFRFNNNEELNNLFLAFPDVYRNSKLPINSDDAKYFTYRDLSSLGSHGVR